MKNVLLLGDSIRYGAKPNSPGYGICVKEKLEGIANVLAPSDNCRFVQYTQRYLYDWANEIENRDEIDVIHWNNGLWDVLRMNGDEPMTPPHIYVYFLERVYNMLVKLFPNAKIIFALSTAVIEEWANPNFIRLNSDIEIFNDEARKLMDSLGVEVNDLYSLTKDFDQSLHSDWVHFGAEGSEIIACQVVEKIKAALQD
ncbi:MAG: SGNH/GDSL hydrolase family protein [Ruminococcaceae bacterium]|nr:SGNH/GDSL hydrolase family protein [Oscillospiraceae bacterium]